MSPAKGGEEDGPQRTGRRLGSYEVLKRISLSSTAEVFSAQHIESGEHVAIKRLLPHAFEEPEVRARFEDEVRATMANTHPGVVRGLEVLAAPAPEGQVGDPCLVMALVDGTALSALLASRPAVAQAALLHAARDLASSLQPLHKAGVAHGDVSGKNVLVDREGDFTWLDLGSAAVDGTAATDAGTPRYVSPERTAQRRVTTRGDIYGLGVLLWELAVGQRWPVDAPLEALPASCPSSGTALGDLIGRCVSRQPEARPANAGELLASLSDLGGDVHRERQAWRSWTGSPSGSPEPGITARQGIVAWAVLLSALGIALWTAAWFIAQTL